MKKAAEELIKKYQEEIRKLRTKLYGKKVTHVAEKLNVDPELVAKIKEELEKPMKKHTKVEAKESFTLGTAIQILKEVLGKHIKYKHYKIDNPKKVAEAIICIAKKKGRGYRNYIVKTTGASYYSIDALCRILGIRSPAYNRKKSKESYKEKLDKFFEDKKIFWHTLESVHEETGVPRKVIDKYVVSLVEQGKAVTDLTSDGKVRFRVKL